MEEAADEIERLQAALKECPCPGHTSGRKNGMSEVTK
jgi:hypothetical protein